MKLATLVLYGVTLQVGLFPMVAAADMIVDTGAPSGLGLDDPGLGINNGTQFPFGSMQSLAGEFTITQAYDITSLSAFVKQYALQVCPCTPMTATFHLGLATGSVSSSGSTLTDLLSLPVAFTTLSSDPSTVDGWASVSVPNYLLPAGTYWIVASATDTDNPINLGMAGGVANPMAAYAITSGSPDAWKPLPVFDVNVAPTLGFQVEGQPVSSVPLPDTLGLLVSGIGALLLLGGRLGFGSLLARAAQLFA